MMSAKHYRAIAEALREDRAWTDMERAYDGAPASYETMDAWTRGAYDQWHTSVLAIARVLQSDNPRFDADRFYRAAGFQGGAR